MKKIASGLGGSAPEGPHLYKIKDYYYLMSAEGGTGYEHREVIQRSKSPWGPYEASPYNPAASHWKNPENPIQAIGHADLVETPDGWWLVQRQGRTVPAPAPLGLTVDYHDLGQSVTPAGSVQPPTGITNQSFATMCRVLRITHDKGWFNDDDPGATYPGWARRCNLGTGDYNNDLTLSNTPGDVWSCSFTGTSVAVIAPKEAGAGTIGIQVDGQTRASADLSTTGRRQAQQAVSEVTALTLAVIDVAKNQEKGHDNHGSKVIVVPFNGAGLDRDSQTNGKAKSL